MSDDAKAAATVPTSETRDPNLSTEHQAGGDARRPSDTLDRDQPVEEDGPPRDTSLFGDDAGAA